MIADKIREEYHQTPQEFCEESYGTDDIRDEHTAQSGQIFFVGNQENSLNQDEERTFTMGGM